MERREGQATNIIDASTSHSPIRPPSPKRTQDHDEGGIVAAEPVERNPEVYRSLLSYVPDARKEEIYRLHKLDPQVRAGGSGWLWLMGLNKIGGVVLGLWVVGRRVSGFVFGGTHF